MGRKPKGEEVYVYMGFPGGSVVKSLPVNTGDIGSIPGSGRSSGEGNGNPFQYSCLGMGYSPWGCKRVGDNLNNSNNYIIYEKRF